MTEEGSTKGRNGFGGRTLPDGWRLATLGEICKRMSNGTSATQNTEKLGLPVTRIETISSGTINPNRVGYIDASEEDLQRYVLDEGDIVFSHINSVEKLGNCAIFESHPKILIHGMNLLRFEVNRDVVDPYYLLAFLKSGEAKRFCADNARRAIGQASLNTKDLSKLEIPLATLHEQKRIAAILTQQLAAIHQAQRAAQEQLEAIDSIPALLLRRAFTGEL